MTPEKIGRYEIKGELGRGGMATVYRGYDPSFEREVAIKVLPREFLHDPQFHDRFKREIKTIAALEHPAIVPVYDVGDEDGVPYFVMRYMPGGSLTQWIEKGKFSLEDAARIIERVSSALAYAHKHGVVHRDLKPDNILFDNNGDPFISDFGVAKFSDSASNMTGSGIIGTPAYMSPEQAQGEPVDNRSDIYGLGVIIFQMLSGHQPYEATTPMGLAVKHITDPVPDILSANPDLPRSTDKIIKTAMAKNRDERYPSATDLANAMNQAASEDKGAAPSIASAKQSGANNRGLFYLIGGAVVLLLLVAAMFFMKALLIKPTGVASATLPPAASGLASPVGKLAPACAQGVISAVGAAPAVSLYQEDCSGNVPAAEISLPTGAIYESLKSGITCAEMVSPAGKRLLTCSGSSLRFAIKVCSSAPTPASGAASAQCAAGTSFDSTNGCCAPAAATDAGCTTFSVNLHPCK